MIAPTVSPGRLAGAIYVFLVATGIIGLAYVPGQLVDLDDPAGTLAALRSNAALFEFGLAAELACYTSFVFLALAFHRLLHPVSPFGAAAVASLALVSVPISFSKMTHMLDLLRMIRGEGSAARLDEDALALELLQHYEAYFNATWAVYVFWGLWLVPLGLVILRTGLIPRWLGAFLVLGGLGYVVTAFGRILWPGFLDSPVAAYATLPSSIGEIGTALWLLVMGARQPPRPETAPSLPGA